MYAKSTYPTVDDHTFMYEEEINGGIFDYFPSSQASGTGVFDTYLALKNNSGTEMGFNTGGKVSDYDEDDSKTSALPLDAVPLVLMEGTLYREFCVDINEVSGEPSQFISLDVMQIWQTDINNLEGQYSMSTYSFSSSEPVLIYDMDGGYDNGHHSESDDNKTLILDYGVNTGSGKPDYKLFLPASWFTNQEYVVMITVHGFAGDDSNGFDASDGFEEWGVRKVQTATKSGMKFEDLDADGVKDAGEPGLSGWTIYVDYDNDGSFDAGEPSAVTGTNGTYEITGILPGTWRVREVLQAGWTQSYPVSGYHEETFVGGMSYPDNNFGNWYPATKSGMKFEDLDADGIKDAGEPGLSGWTIYVDYDNDGVLDAEEPSAITGAGGAYTIMGIKPGTWRVKEVTQAGWTQSYPGAPGYHEETFTSRAALTGNDFGNWYPATKSGVKFEDLDADGADREAGEPGLSGWTIYVDYDNDSTLDAGEPSAVTGAGGAYTISGINPGTWRVKEVAQAGWTQSFPASGYHEETFVSSGTYPNNNFGNWTTATKSGVKFEDLDADGANREGGEPGLFGWTIFVDYDDDGVLDAGEPSAATDSDGEYTITGILPGTWKVKEVLQAGWTQSYPAGGYHQEAFSSRSVLTENNFGNWYPATKSGMKFEDLDADGVKDAGEPGLSGWTIYVDYDNDGVKDAGEPSAVTASDGTYTITGITPGTWRVKEVPQAGWTNSFPALGYHEETFTSRAALTGNDFGNWYPATKSGMKFEDLDADGVKDAGEPGLSGWTIYVDYDNDGVKDAGEPSAVTAADGTYTITGITPGTWRVKEVAQAGWTQSYPASGYHEETFTSRAALTGNDFGNWYPATKSGMKFEDLDADGVKDAGELGLSGWTIFVDYDDNGVLDADEPSAVTAADGTYTITGIKPGTYKVREVLKAGWTNSFPALGYYNETFTSREAVTGNDFGNWYPATKSGYKFMDDNQNGIFDEGEFGLQGWTIKLWTRDSGDNLIEVASTITDATGYYAFTNIHPGKTYYVSEVMPNSLWTQTCPNSSITDAMILADHPELGYVYVINLQSREVHANNNFGNWYYHDETAWAYGGEDAIELNSIVGNNKWGWTNGPYTLDDLTAGIELELRAAVGQNDVNNKGTLVGMVNVQYDSGNNDIVVTYLMDGDNKLTSAQLWVGSTKLPEKKTGKKFVPTADPGQFPFKWTGAPTNEYTFTIDLDDPKQDFITNSDVIYIAAHADVRMFEEID